VTARSGRELSFLSAIFNPQTSGQQPGNAQPDCATGDSDHTVEPSRQGGSAAKTPVPQYLHRNIHIGHKYRRRMLLASGGWQRVSYLNST